ncbi:DUF4240 domain-containing protein [Spirillospora sp. NPDC047279]|uniref:DUF4240 domain-containing protein n=1 Tax=Spirillospora sp. NPDC047279 TaxID=3155478 RepID=UPI0033CD264D
MHVDAFWDLIEESHRQWPDPDLRLTWLEERLSTLPPTEIVDFQIHLDEAKRRTDTWLMWGAAYLVCDSLCSSDGFWYFQPWLVGLGRETFERVVADPDELINVPEIRRLAGRPTGDWSNADWPGWESLNYSARVAYDKVTGEVEGIFDAMEARGHLSGSDPDPSGERWDFEDPAEAARRLPRLSTVFPLSDQSERDRRGQEAFEQLLAERGQTEEEFWREFGGGRGPSATP